MDDNWYPAENIKNAQIELATFHKKNPEAAGPPVYLQEWSFAAVENMVPPVSTEDNRAESKKRERLGRHR